MGSGETVFMSWYVYIVQCKDSKLYTGITNNLKRRINAHNSGSGGKFTTVTCSRCKYTEIYRATTSTLSNVFDFFTN